MKLRKWLPAALLLMTAILAIVYISSRDKVPEGTIAVEYEDQVSYVTTIDMDAVEIDTELTDAKGETYWLTAVGVELSEVLRKAGVDPATVDQVTVLASDEYSATVTGDEVRTNGKVCLLLAEDEAPELVVLGDPNRKRNVSNVERITVD